MLGRRGFLGLLGASPFVARGAVTPPVADMAGMVGASTNVAVPFDPFETSEMANDVVDDIWRRRQRVIDLFYRDRELRQRPVKNMPLHVAGKRSWSPAFKQAVFMREEQILEQYIQKLNRDQAFVDKIADILDREGG